MVERLSNSKIPSAKADPTKRQGRPHFMRQFNNPQPPEPIRADLKSEWLLDPKITFLNHGSFGSVPKCVLVEQTRWRRDRGRSDRNADAPPG